MAGSEPDRVVMVYVAPKAPTGEGTVYRTERGNFHAQTQSNPPQVSGERLVFRNGYYWIE